MKRMKAASHAKIESWVPLMEEAFIDMDEGPLPISSGWRMEL